MINPKSEDSCVLLITVTQLLPLASLPDDVNKIPGVPDFFVAKDISSVCFDVISCYVLIIPDHSRCTLYISSELILGLHSKYSRHTETKDLP